MSNQDDTARINHNPTYKEEVLTPEAREICAGDLSNPKPKPPAPKAEVQAPEPEIVNPAASKATIPAQYTTIQALRPDLSLSTTPKSPLEHLMDQGLNPIERAMTPAQWTGLNKPDVDTTPPGWREEIAERRAKIEAGQVDKGGR